MKKIGIVGGVAWLSTVEYYSELCRRSEQWWRATNRQGPPATPEMSIESLDLNQAVSYLGTDGDEDSCGNLTTITARDSNAWKRAEPISG